jgi:hypothetical protein
MAFFVPGSRCLADEFQAADGQWYSAMRAVSFNSWLQWRDALPAEPAQRRRLTPAIQEAISSLGRHIDELHQRLGEYRRLGASPFRVGRWWDPDGEPPWDSGRRILLRHERLSAQDLLVHRPPRCPLLTATISTHWLELELPATAVVATGAPATTSRVPPGRRRPAL